MQTIVKNIPNSFDFIKCGEILKCNSESYQNPYVLKCFQCKEIYLLLESFIFHMENRCKDTINQYSNDGKSGNCIVNDTTNTTSLEYEGERFDQVAVKEEDTNAMEMDPLVFVKSEIMFDDEDLPTKQNSILPEHHLVKRYNAVGLIEINKTEIFDTTIKNTNENEELLEDINSEEIESGDESEEKTVFSKMECTKDVASQENQFDAILKELQYLRQFVSIEMSNNQKATTRLAEEIIALKHDLAKSNLQNFGEMTLLPPLPLSTVETLAEFDNNLAANELLLDQYKQFLRRFGGGDMPSFLRASLKKTVTDGLATKYTWSGTREKPSIQSFNFIFALKATCHTLFSNLSEKSIDSIIQRHFLHAKDRLEKRNKLKKLPVKL